MTEIDSILFSFPIIILFLIWALTIYNEGKLPLFKSYLGLVILLITAILIAFSTGGPDKIGYEVRFIQAEERYCFNGSYNFSENGKNEFVFAYYSLYLGRLFNENTTLCFIFTALIYCLSYYKVATKFFSNKTNGYFILMVIGCLGFNAYGNNTIRAGLAIAVTLWAFSIDNLIIRLLLCYFAINIHKSVAMPIGAYLFVTYYPNKFNYEKIWIFCLILSVLHVDLSSFYETIGVLDNRINSYVTASSQIYKQGFRIDFLIYSFIPILISGYECRHSMKDDVFYNKIYKTYLFVNSFWLLVIRASYTDRFAYLSWFMIPFITLYPFLNNDNFRKRPFTLIFILTSFIGLDFVLGLR